MLGTVIYVLLEVSSLALVSDDTVKAKLQLYTISD